MIVRSRAARPRRAVTGERHMERVGFIGVGAMGAAIAARMIAHGVPVLACDNDANALARIRAKGASTAGSVREVVDAAQLVFACLPTAAVCRAVALGPDGVAAGRQVRIYVETSTLGGEAATQLADGLAAHGIAYIDAPVIGGVLAAESGTLGVLAAGPQAAYDRVKPVFDAFAGKVFYLGEKTGMAQVAKVVSNAVSYAALYASFEAIAVGMKAGIDLETLVAIVNQGSGANFHTQKIFPNYIIPGRFEGTGAVEIGVKDVKYFLAEARRLQARTPMAEFVSTLGVRAAEAGPPGRDTMTLFHYFCDLAGVPRRAAVKAGS
jgi:3-hydroxyisobutyrate dehydrogenase-like beta-hydroxyacid dehydrogenase